MKYKHQHAGEKLKVNESSADEPTRFGRRANRVRSRFLPVLTIGVAWLACIILEPVYGQADREAELNRLLQELKHSDSEVRRSAVEVLGRLGDSRAVEPLLAALADSSSTVRESAAAALGQSGDPRAVESLIANLGDFGRSSDAAVEALVELGDIAVAPLIKALQVPNEKVRASAARALGCLGNSRAIDSLIGALKSGNLLVGSRDVSEAAAWSLGEMGDSRAVPELIDVLENERWTLRDEAAVALGKIGDARAFAPLVALLRTSDLNDDYGFGRAAAAEALGHLGDPRGVDPLIAALKFRNEYVRRSSAGALGQLGDSRAVEPLIAALKDSDFKVRKSAASALGQLADQRAVEPLIATLEDPQSKVQDKAAESLLKLGTPTGNLGDKRATDPLLLALATLGPDTRNQVAVQLDKWGDSLGLLINRSLTGDQEAMDALADLKDPRVVPILISAALQHYDEKVRASAAESLKNLHDPRAVEELIAAFKDWRVREKATTALEILGAPAVVPLIAALKDSDGGVRQSAAAALGQNGDPRAIEALIATLRDRDLGVRESAAAALVKLGDPAVEPLIEVLKDSNLYSEVRRSAAWVLGQLGDPRAVEPLSRCLFARNAYDSIKFTSANALAKLGKAGISHLISALGDSEERVREAAFKSLEQKDPAIATLTLACVAGDEAALGQLRQSGDSRAMLAFIRAAHDPDRAFRASAIAAFVRVADHQPFHTMVARAAASWQREERLGATRLLATASPVTLGSLGLLGGVLVSTASLGYVALVFISCAFPYLWIRSKRKGGFWIAGASGGLIWSAIHFAGGLTPFAAVPLLFWWRGWKGGARLPGWAGWMAMGTLLVSIPLYGRYLLDGPGGWVLMGVSLTPLWLALLCGFVQGAILWPRTWRKAKAEVCQTHFSRFAPLARTWLMRWSGGSLFHPRNWDGDLTSTCGCRVCGKRQPSLAGIRRVIAVLDKEGDWVEQNSGDGDLRVNWLKHRKPFDFDAVEVVSTTDEEVEDFTNQMRFESEERIASRLLKMDCRVQSQCILKEGTIRLLKLTFAKLERN